MSFLGRLPLEKFTIVALERSFSSSIDADRAFPDQHRLHYPVQLNDNRHRQERYHHYNNCKVEMAYIHINSN
ncbi:hypothetical protein AYI69_g4427 [Smittium culicis]|uniref:Uncharacterized protein n=1 Tax=Smittium culicis TaxID=133412 RepID=A0A1R1YDR8_9FUNG|nr:hypothetical protein AYI69_g4427 [Smittium culicis]